MNRPLITRPLHRVWGDATDAWCWLTGKSNFSFARGMLITGWLLYTYGMYRQGAGLMWGVMMGLVTALIYWASYRREREVKRLEGSDAMPRYTQSSLIVEASLSYFHLLLGMPVDPITNLGLVLWWGVDFIEHHINSGGKSAVARARDWIASHLPALQPATVPVRA